MFLLKVIVVLFVGFAYAKNIKNEDEADSRIIGGVDAPEGAGELKYLLFY